MLCICGHPEEDHEKGWGMCEGRESATGASCPCVMFEMYEPELDDDDDYPWRDYDDDN